VLIGIHQLLGADYQPTDNQPVPYRCISDYNIIDCLNPWTLYTYVV